MHFEPRLNHSFRGETQVLANRYRILMPIGEGGMGAVYQAYDLCLGRVVAIKQLHVQFEGDPVGQRRFFREAETAAAMSHHNIVEIYDLGWTDDHRMFIVMEYLDGEDLFQTLKREGPMSWARVRDIALKICRGVRAAHEKGIVHRDLKPQNCFRVERDEEEDFIKILDFGLAKPLASNPSGQITRTGEAMGTPSFMAPEYIEGGEAQPCSDFYALGVIIYQLLTGVLPFSSRNGPEALLIQIYRGCPELPPGVGARVPQGVQSFLRRMLHADPKKRFSDAQEVLRALKNLRPRLFTTGSLNKQPPTAAPEIPAAKAVPVASQRPRVIVAPRFFSPTAYQWTLRLSVTSVLAAVLSVLIKVYVQ